MLQIPNRIHDILESLVEISPVRAGLLRRDEPSSKLRRATYMGQNTSRPPFGNSQNDTRWQYYWAARRANLDWDQDIENVDQVGFALAILDKILEFTAFSRMVMQVARKILPEVRPPSLAQWHNETMKLVDEAYHEAVKVFPREAPSLSTVRQFADTGLASTFVPGEDAIPTPLIPAFKLDRLGRWSAARYGHVDYVCDIVDDDQGYYCESRAVPTGPDPTLPPKGALLLEEQHD